MKILFVSTAPLEYSASSNMRNIALLKGFIENGYKVYTLTPEPQKDSVLYDESINNITIEKKYYIPLGTIHSAATMKKDKKSRIKDAIYHLLKKFKIYDFRSTLAKKKIEIEEKFDYIISSSDPKSSHLMAESVIKNNKDIAQKWIQYWGDPFANDINNNGFMPKFMIKREEERILKLADKIIYVSPFTLEKQKKTYASCSDKMFFLPIPYKEKIIYNQPESDIIKLGYFGDYYSRNRNIKPLYNVIKSKEEKQLIICGSSDLELEPRKNIQIYTRQPIQKIRELEENVSMLVCICNKGGTQIPGKIYHYSATNKPILIIVDGEYAKEIKRYLEEYNRFIICNNNEEEISKVIDKLKNEKNDYQPLKRLEAKNIVKELLNK